MSTMWRRRWTKSAKPMRQAPLIDCNPAYRTIPHPREKFTPTEIDSFEQALPVYGKNFFVIRSHVLPHRRVGELVEFYYHWKKSERHDVFIERARQRRLNAQEGDPPMLFPVFRQRLGRVGDPMDALILAHHSVNQPVMPRSHHPQLNTHHNLTTVTTEHGSSDHFPHSNGTQR
ncbi:hypothetical protein L596_000451 [Steinernema carpocapsae]|uniref:SANT domain-containing protein n=1 Tax=Steinernema carpocapsae TaxID=34508 RepID=A0A4U8UIE8_STECR|nr:hypothetical protein L596_000451 [Steinernema carpocapsae]